MGYSYTADGKLCCDVCEAAGARKYKCPFGYCPAIALCPTCKAAHPEYTSKAGHRAYGCDTKMEAARQHDRELLNLIAAGHPVRCAALWHPGLKLDVKVIFTKGPDADGHRIEVAYWMDRDTYDAIPLLVNATLEDYQKIGQVEPARNADIYDTEMEPAPAPEPEPDRMAVITQGLAQQIANRYPGVGVMCAGASVITDDGLMDGGAPYTDEEMAVINTTPRQAAHQIELLRG